jgi:hypothetical protein
MQIGRRAAPRARVHLPVTLLTPNGGIPAMLENISGGGARVRLNETPRPGSTAFLLFAGLELFCSVVWTRGGCCGLAFDDPVQDATLIAIRRYSDQYVAEARSQAMECAGLRTGAFL